MTIEGLISECQTKLDKDKAWLLKQLEAPQSSQGTNNNHKLWQKRLSEVDNAFDRIAQGIFRICSVCGGPIEEERLRAIPTATDCMTCIACKNKTRNTNRLIQPSVRPAVIHQTVVH